MSLDYLPPATRELAELIGLPALLALAEWRGGVQVYIPMPENLDLDHPLAQCIGLFAARKLASHYGGAALEVPKCAAHARQVLHHEIRQRRARGETETQVALATGVTGRWVRVLCKRGREKEEDRQPDLFD